MQVEIPRITLQMIIPQMDLIILTLIESITEMISWVLAISQALAKNLI